MNRKKIFDTVRRLLGRSFTQPEVVELDAAIDAMVTGGDEPRLPLVGTMKVSKAGVDFIHSFEQLRLKAYPDPGSSNGEPWTIGWGSTTDLNGNPIKPGTVWTKAMADQKFAQDLAKFEAGVNRLIGTTPTTQNQFDALVSFAYNAGLDIDDDTKAEGLGDSTLLKHHNAGRYDSASLEFVKWNKNDGRVMRGLTRRRFAEAEIYRGK